MYGQRIRHISEVLCRLWRTVCFNRRRCLRYSNGLSVLRAEYIILFKAKAYLDLKMRKDLGEKVDSSDIKKHKKDVLRIASELMLEKVEELPIAVNTDIHSLINLLEQEPFDQNSLKRYMLKNEDVVELLKRVFG